MVEFGITTQFLVLNPKNKIQNLNQNANLATKNIKKVYTLLFTNTIFHYLKKY